MPLVLIMKKKNFVYMIPAKQIYFILFYYTDMKSALYTCPRRNESSSAPLWENPHLAHNISSLAVLIVVPLFMM